MSDDGATLPPDDAFALLGNETRIQILQTLAAADSPLPFSELHDRVGLRDSGQFNYHLDKLVGHFVCHTDDGYELQRAGERVVEAVLSGAVTDQPVLEPTQVDFPCPFCGAPVEVTFRQERLELYCTSCPGTYGPSDDVGDADPESRHGYLGYQPLPPAGLKGRTADDVLRAAVTWGHLELLGAASGVCPRCSAGLERDLRVCESHDAGEGLCQTCGRRYAAVVDLGCTNCIYDETGSALIGLASATPLLAFVTAHGYNPVAPSAAGHPTVTGVFSDYEEAVLSTDPVEIRFTVTLDGDALSITIDEDLTIVDVSES